MNSSIDMSASMSASRSIPPTVQRRVTSPAAAALQSQQRQRQEEEKQQQQQHQHSYSSSLYDSPSPSAARVAALSASFTQTVPRPLVPSVFAASSASGVGALSSLSSAELGLKARQVEVLISEFDSKVLGGATATYPQWALPFVQEMATKLQLVLQAQKIARENEARQKEQADRDRELADTVSRTLKFESAAEEQQAAAARSLRVSRQGQSTPSSGRFYPDDSYLVGLNSPLAFTRDHGSFVHRAAAPTDPMASPRRNLGVDRTHTNSLRDANGAIYQQHHHQQHHQQQQAQQQQQQRPVSARRLASTTSARYLTNLLGHDVGASTLNRLFRSTERSPSPPPRRREPLQTKELPGPTIPKARRFSASQSLLRSPAPKTPSKKDAAASDRARQRDLEMQALKIQVDELMHTLEQQQRDREWQEAEDRRRAALAASAREALPPPPPPPPQPQTLDEDALASALLRIGESNRHKFLGLIQQIAAMQRGMLEQQEKINLMASQQMQGAAVASRDAEAEEQARLTQQRMQAELDRLSSELSSTLSAKEKLAAQVKSLALHSERSKFALMEKVSGLSSSDAERARAAQRDQALLRTYESDLRASRDAISQLQAMLQREAGHARSFQAESAELQKRLDKVTGLLGAQNAQVQGLSFQAGRASLKPAEKFRALMHKYLASFYRGEFQKLLAARAQTSSHAARIEAELQRTAEKHELELVYQSRSHEAVLKHVSSSLEASEAHQEELQEQLEGAQTVAATLEEQRDEAQRDLLATELLNQRLASQLAAAAGGQASATDSDFSALMVASFKGDYLQMRNDTRILKTIYGLGDEEIRFSDYVQRIDRSARSRHAMHPRTNTKLVSLSLERTRRISRARVVVVVVLLFVFVSHNKYQQRILLLTNRHLVCLWSDRGRPVRRVIPVLDIRHISLSRQAANVFVVHASDAYDYLFLSAKRAEIMYHLLQLTQQLSSGTRSLQYRFGERLYVGDRDHKYREVQVAESGIILGEASYRHHDTAEEEREHIMNYSSQHTHQAK